MIKKRTYYILIALILLPALITQGCLFPVAPSAATPSSLEEPEETPEEITPVPSITPSASAPARGNFTLRYNSSYTLNPITSQSSDNLLLASLMYEPLFIIDDKLNVEPLLCESWTIDGEYTYTFEIKPDIAMSDGSTLTANDVAYTLKQAMRTGRFVNPLKIIDSVTVTGDLTVSVVLNSANRKFIRLLDIPIIKDGSIDSNVPPGTGPYIFTGTQRKCLEGFPLYRDARNLPIHTIYLIECEDNEMAELFDDGELTLLWDDPSDTFDIRLNRLHEKHYYDTTAMHYIGFSTRSAALRDPDVRRAISYSIDRQYICDNIMPRQALPSPLALSPAYSLYDPEWERTIRDPLMEMSALLYRAGLDDFNNDSYLEYPDGFGGYSEISIDFIVNSANLYKVEIANLIADTLKRTGFNITVRELPRDRFLEALESGDFDMYYGEIVLSADFDLSPLLLPGSSINYGGTGNTEYIQLISDFLFATSEYGEQLAAKILCDEITLTSPFVPILYKKYVVYMPMAAIFGSSPCQSGVFYNITDWSIDFTMLT